MPPSMRPGQKVSPQKTSEKDRLSKLADVTSTNHMVLKGKLEGLETKTMQRFDKVESDIAGLKTDVNGLKTDVAVLKTDVTGLKTDVTGLKTDVAGLKTEVAELKTEMNQRFDKVESDVSELKTDVAGLKVGMSEQTDLLKMIAKNVRK